MKRNGLIFISTMFILLLLFTGCNQQPEIDMVEALSKSQELLRQSEEIETTAASFDGKSNVKFRIMVNEQLTEEEAIILFNKILDTIANFSNHSDVWDYYNGFFDVKRYSNGVIYEATKLIGEDLEVVSKP